MARPDTFGAWGLRTQAEIDSVAQLSPQSGWSYDPTMDAARGIDQATYPNDADIRPQLRFPLNVTDGSITVVWDYLRPAAWLNEPQSFVTPDTGKTLPGLASLKAFQISTPPNNSVRFEVRNHFNKGNPDANEVAQIDMRSYHDMLGPGTCTSLWTGCATGVGSQTGVLAGSTVQPLLAKAYVHGDKWLRYVLRVEVAYFTDANGVQYDACSLWVIEEDGQPIQLQDRWLGHNYGGLTQFWIEEDASDKRAPGSAPLYTYARNVWIGRNVTDVKPLLQAPGTSGPLPPTNVRLVR